MGSGTQRQGAGEQARPGPRARGAQGQGPLGKTMGTGEHRRAGGSRKPGPRERMDGLAQSPLALGLNIQRPQSLWAHDLNIRGPLGPWAQATGLFIWQHPICSFIFGVPFF